tara:strand:- start:134 stop:370 length:237 start_codon:yes stop_codon:yes gene_type:complete
MCKIGEFKLCTCSDKIDKSKPHWILEKLSVNKDEIDEVAFTLIYTNGKWREFDDEYCGLEENQKQFNSHGEISILTKP